MFYRFVLGVIVLMFSAVALVAENSIGVPYGVCSHVSRSWADAPLMKQEFKLMRQAGIRKVRTDFDWNLIQPRKDVWKFEHIDKLMSQANQDGMTILPILAYNVSWAKPAYKHLDDWGKYVSTIALRYGHSIQHWEVWNEENGELFWGETANASNYVQLLKRTYDELKKINPRFQVGFGGTAGVPLAYIENALDAGAGKYIDFFAIHPYSVKGSPETIVAKVTALRKLFRRYGIENMPIMITEFGYSTPPECKFFQDVLPAVLNKIEIDPSRSEVAVIRDSRYGLDTVVTHEVGVVLPKFKQVREIDYAMIAQLDPSQTPLLLPTNTEVFPITYVPDLVKYLKKGGSILFPCGLPIYFDLLEWGGNIPDNSTDYKGMLVQQKNAEFMTNLHLGWETWWTRKGIPKEEKSQSVAPPFAEQFELKGKFHPSGRFLTGKNLRPGDRLLPVINGKADHYENPVMAIYKFNSDLKGNIIVYTGLEKWSCSERIQAATLPRAYLCSLSVGVKDLYWYRFRASERPDRYWDHEEYFGIIRSDLSNKPAFNAYKVLTTMLPPYSSRPVLSISRTNNLWIAVWTKPDGEKIHALWTQQKQEKVTLKPKGKISKIIDYLGNRLEFCQEMRIGNGIVYIVGAEEILVTE